MPTSQIVIKIKDEYFLQQETVTNNPGKIIIGGEFPFESTENVVALSGIYNSPALKTHGNISGSKIVFQNLLDLISRLAIGGAIESSFSIIDNTKVLNLMRMAKDRTGYVGENLLNFYFIEVNVNEVEQRLKDINELKNGNPLLGIDYVYVEGELADFNITPISIGISNHLPDDVRISEARNLVSNISTRIKKTVIIPEQKAMRTSTDSLNRQISTNEPSQFGKAVINPLIGKIKSVFEYCGITNYDAELSNIIVVDIEQGWGDTMGLIINGGKHNYIDIDKQNHGKKTLNLLYGNDDGNPNTLKGLCKKAKIHIASTWYNSTKNYRAGALASVLGHVYINPINQTITKDIPIVNIGDIVLLELQVTQSYIAYDKSIKSAELPVEIEPLMWAAIKLGVDSGFILIEAAGNANGKNPTTNTYSSIYLDNIGYIPPLRDLSKNAKDSTRAIIVGAIQNNPTSTKILNQGSRVDFSCFGEDILTSAVITPTIKRPFNSTSLASAITTALVAHFQSNAMKPFNSSDRTLGGIGRRLTISEIKILLSSIFSINQNYLNFYTFLAGSSISENSTILSP